VQSGLAGGVASSGDDHLLPLDGPGLGYGGAVEDPEPPEGLEAGDAQPRVRHASGQDDGPGAHLGTGGENGRVFPGTRP
jgi:hypothetical protein